MIARPSATRCCWPPESCEGLRSSSAVEAEQVGDAIEPPRVVGRAARARTLTPNRMFSATLRCGNSAYDWNTIEMRRSAGASAGDVAARRSRSARRSALSSPAIMRSVVDLPQPEGPSRTTSAPDAVAKLALVDRLRRAPVLADALETQRAHAGESLVGARIDIVSDSHKRPWQGENPGRRASPADDPDAR